MSNSTRLNPTALVVAIMLALLFIFALFLMRDASNNRSLNNTNSLLSQTKSALSDIESKLQASLGVEKDLHQNIAAQKKYHTETQQALQKELDGAREANQLLTADMEKLKVQHAEAIATERSNVEQALAAREQAHHLKLTQVSQAAQEKQDQVERAFSDLQGEFIAAEQNIVGLEKELDALHEMQEETKARHVERVRQLTEKSEHYRTALEGSDPERAAQMAAIEQQIQAFRDKLAEAQQTRMAMESTYESRLTAAGQTIAEKQNALEQMGVILDNTKTELSQTQSTLETVRMEARTEAERLDVLLQQEQAEATKAMENLRNDYGVQLEQLNARLSTTVQQVQSLQTELENTRNESQTTQATMREEHATQMEQAQQELSRLTQTLQQEKLIATQAIEALQQEHSGKMEQLSSQFEVTQQELNTTQTTLETTRKEAAETQQAMQEEHARQLGKAREELAQLNRAMEQQKNEATETLAGLREEQAEELGRLNTELTTTQQSLNESRRHYTNMKQLHSRFAELGGQYTQRGMQLTLGESELQFPGGKSTLPTTGLESLDQIAGFLNEQSNVKILIEGHTDSGGGERFNLRLSERRADAVKQALLERGIAEERMQTAGIGEVRPTASNQTFDGRRQNRRVEIFIIKE